MYAMMRESNVTPHVNNFFTVSFQLIASNFSSVDCLSLIFHLDCTKWCRFTFLTHVSKRRRCLLNTKPNKLREWLYQQCNQSTHKLMAWQWYHFLLSSNNRQAPPRKALHYRKWSGTVYAKTHWTENCRM